jgi:hypothetical protein
LVVDTVEESSKVDAKTNAQTVVLATSGSNELSTSDESSTSDYIPPSSGIGTAPAESRRTTRDTNTENAFLEYRAGYSRQHQYLTYSPDANSSSTTEPTGNLDTREITVAGAQEITERQSSQAVMEDVFDQYDRRL